MTILTFMTFLSFRSGIGVLGPARCLPRPSRAEGENHIIHKGPCHIGLYRDNGKEHGNYNNGLYRGYIGIMEKKMETIIVYWSYIGIIRDYRNSPLGLCRLVRESPPCQIGKIGSLKAHLFRVEPGSHSPAPACDPVASTVVG